MTLTSGFTSYGHVQIFSNVYREGDKACQIGVFNVLPLQYLPRTIFALYNIYREGSEACPHPTHARPHPARWVWQMRWRDHLHILRVAMFWLFVCLFVYLHRCLHIFQPPHILNAAIWNKSKYGHLTQYRYSSQSPLKVYAVALTVKNLCTTNQTSERYSLIQHYILLWITLESKKDSLQMADPGLTGQDDH